jgi:hypothetical protein
VKSNTKHLPFGWDPNLVEKPPLGLMPKNIHNQRRILDILSAIERYVKADMPIMPEWLDELAELTDQKES